MRMRISQKINCESEARPLLRIIRNYLAAKDFYSLQEYETNCLRFNRMGEL
jgi:hypothetical protein